MNAGLVTGLDPDIDLVSYIHAAERVDKSKDENEFRRDLVSYIHAREAASISFGLKGFGRDLVSYIHGERPQRHATYPLSVAKPSAQSGHAGAVAREVALVLTEPARHAAGLRPSVLGVTVKPDAHGSPAPLSLAGLGATRALARADARVGTE